MNDTRSYKFTGCIIRKSDLRLTESQNPFIRVTLAAKRKATDGEGGLYRRLDFAQIVIWDSMARGVASMLEDSEIEVDA